MGWALEYMEMKTGMASFGGPVKTLRAEMDPWLRNQGYLGVRKVIPGNPLGKQEGEMFQNMVGRPVPPSPVAFPNMIPHPSMPHIGASYSGRAVDLSMTRDLAQMRDTGGAPIAVRAGKHPASLFSAAHELGHQSAMFHDTPIPTGGFEKENPAGFAASQAYSKATHEGSGGAYRPHEETSADALAHDFLGHLQTNKPQIYNRLANRFEKYRRVQPTAPEAMAALPSQPSLEDMEAFFKDHRNQAAGAK